MDAAELEVRLVAKLIKEREFMEQTAKAIEYHEQHKLDGPHVQHVIDLLHKSYAASQKIINAITPTNKYGKPYMEK